MERLQKVIAQAGIASRRKAEQLIADGRVKVNGKTVTEMGVQVSPQDEIMVDNQVIGKEEKVYYLLNKPKQTICAVKDDRGRTTVIDCLPSVKERIFPVGRLDYETTGLLLLTNDGEFANLMMHPRSHIHKTYEVSVDGVITDEMAERLEKGIPLEDGMTLPAEVLILQRSKKKNRTVLQITIQEGRNREVRRMMEYFHCSVRYLNRIAYAFLDLGKLRQGEARKLRSYEVRKLENLVQADSSGNRQK
jgi:23S rRNA pseudouridine2605 synthase